MTGRRLGLLSLALCLLGSAAPAIGADIQDHIFSGTKFANEKKYKEAAREFRVALGIDPDHAEANLLLGLTLANTGELEEAVQYSRKAVALKPSYAGYYNLALIHSNQGRYDEAIEAYRQALELNPKSYQAWHQLGKVHSTTLEFEKAIEAYQKAAGLNPKFPDAYQGLGSAYYWSGNLTAALQQVDELHKLGFDGKADELQRWIKDKEAKKKKAVKKAEKTSG